MKITRKDYDKAKSSLPKLEKAKETVKEWDERMKTIPADVRADVSEITDDGSYKVDPRKEVPLARTG